MTSHAAPSPCSPAGSTSLRPAGGAGAATAIACADEVAGPSVPPVPGPATAPTQRHADLDALTERLALEAAEAARLADRVAVAALGEHSKT